MPYVPLFADQLPRVLQFKNIDARLDGVCIIIQIPVRGAGDLGKKAGRPLIDAVFKLKYGQRTSAVRQLDGPTRVMAAPTSSTSTEVNVFGKEA